MRYLGRMFNISEGVFGKITEEFSQGFNFHTVDGEGNCLVGQEYILKSNFNDGYLVTTDIKHRHDDVHDNRIENLTWVPSEGGFNVSL